MKTKRKKVSGKSRSHAGKGVFGTIFLSLTVFLFVTVEFRRSVAQKSPIRQLPVPQLAVLHLPEPLVIKPLETQVLGSGTFDPIEVVAAVNIERTRRGLIALRVNETLMRAARLRAETILKHENFSHYDPYDNIILGTVLPKLGYSYSWASENIGMGGNSGAEFVGGFMISPSHRDNLLDPKLVDTGAAVVDGPYDRYYVNIVVQLFAVPGGRDEYLGYSERDKTFYKVQLERVNANLSPLLWSWEKLQGNPKYTDSYFNLLSRQKEIVSSILTLMNEEKPFENQHVALIKEFNALTNLN